MPRTLAPRPKGAALWVQATVLHAGLGGLGALGCERSHADRTSPPAPVVMPAAAAAEDAPRALPARALAPTSPTPTPVAADAALAAPTPPTLAATPLVPTDAGAPVTAAADAGTRHPSGQAAQRRTRVERVRRNDNVRRVAPTCGPCCHGGGPQCRDGRGDL